MNSRYNEQRHGFLPYDERTIPIQEAVEWYSLDLPYTTRLEGLCFDNEDRLYFVDIDYDILYRIEMSTKCLEKVFQTSGRSFSAVKIHPDGRLFVCCLNPDIGIFTLKPDGSGYKEISLLHGHIIDDMVFDRDGGFYFTELRGEVHRREGAVYYVSPDLTTIQCVIDGLASPNGITLTQNDHVLWVTETTGGRLLRFEMDDSHRLVPYGSFPSYHFSGKPGPDSCTSDAGGNVYVSLYQQGRFMIFNHDGYPIEQIVMPGRAEGRYMISTHCKIRPGTRELYMCATSATFAREAGIFLSESR